MKTIKIDEQMSTNKRNKGKALAAVRVIDKDFYAGKREFDRPRKNPDKQRILERMMSK